MISSGNVDWPQLVANGEKLGIGIEQEEEYFRDQYARRGVGWASGDSSWHGVSKEVFMQTPKS